MTSNPISSSALADLVLKKYPDEVASLRNRMENIRALGRQDDGPEQTQFRDKRNARNYRHTSILDGSKEVHAGFAYMDITDLVTFPDGDIVLVFQALVSGYEHATTRTAHIEQEEYEAWARAALGAEWAEFAYKVSYRDDPVVLRRTFPVVVSKRRGPIEAPSNLDWTRILLDDPKLGDPILTKLVS